ncbi:flavodoxin [Pantoea rwandensis]|uniref:Flavodoxin n=1 Tax=Pantoea rwandensis TaxID=1076550 RepID=A0A1X1D519_9GAMM|nr:flavodoxin [Pantoea rwandensis]ORM71768.1 flavodoxin [Pantoea rwandensis]
MSEEHDATRRMLLAAFAGLTLTKLSINTAVASPKNIQSHNGVLVVYFSRSGNTRVLAGVIHRTLNATIFEIEPENAYPEDYFATVEQAKQQRDQGVKPALKHMVADMERYQTVYLGHPVWGASMPPVVQSFLASHNLENKKIIPFITHGGYGTGDCTDVLARLAPHSQLEQPLVMECDQERKTTETVTNWLASLKI